MDLRKLEELQRQKNITNKKTLTKLVKELNMRGMDLSDYLKDDPRFEKAIKEVNREIQTTVADNIVLTHLKIALTAEKDSDKMAAIDKWYAMSGEAPTKNINVTQNNPFSDFTDDDLDEIINSLGGDKDNV